LPTKPAYGGIGTYPSHTIDPRKKGYDWCLEYVRAAYKDSRGWMPWGALNVGNLKMAEIKMYALGQQPVDKYKKQLSIGDPQNESWRAIDWTPLGLMCKFREIAISKINQKKFDIQAQAIDDISRSEEDGYFNQMKVKLLMREQAAQGGLDPDSIPTLALQPGEPEDMEQLAMEKQYGYKHVMSIEAEDAINLIHQQNNLDEHRETTDENLVDFGIGAYTPWIDENGMVKYRAINPEYLGLSYFEKKDGSDLVHWFEVVPTYVGDLAPYYSKEQLDDICSKAISKNGNPSTFLPVIGYYNQAWNRFKVFVCKIKFLSWNETVYKEEIDSRGNTRFGKSAYENKQFLSVNKLGDLEGDYGEATIPTEDRGEATPKYMNDVMKVVYKASWIIDTDYMHDFGLQENQNRKLSSWWETDLDIYIYAPNFYKMQFAGITERLIKLEDRACELYYNLQNLSNKLIPYLINIDMNAVEGAFNFGKGGGKGKPSEVIDFIFSNFIVPYRAKDIHSRNPNYKPVTIEASGQLVAFETLYNQLLGVIDLMRQVSGLNEATDGSTINPKNLNSTNYSMVESTNNALYLMSRADKNLLLRLSDGIIQKVQIAVKLGKVEGYAKALGSNTVQFFSINPDIALRELGIFIEDAPTDEERQMLLNDASIKESQGLITIGDKIRIMSARNFKKEAMILDYKIQKRKEEQQQFALQQTQAQAEANGQVAQITEQMKQQTIGVQLQADLLKIQTEMEWQYRIEAMKKGADVHGETIQSEARTIGHQIQADAKVRSSEIIASAQLTGKHVDGVTHLLGKHIDAEAGKEIEKLKPKPKKT
jgi:hypothetical protein